MKADLTRDTFDPLRHYTRVLTQQGRVQLDAPMNEQVSIHLHLLRRLARDLIGRHGGPYDAFAISEADDAACPGDFVIGAGHYYVDGILCENDEEVLASCQRYWPAPPAQNSGKALIYLDVWEQHINAIEDPELLELALRGPDTATRARVVWQAKTYELPPAATDTPDLDALFDELRGHPRPRLKARAEPGRISEDACTIPPESRYRGVENQLYRVEIHRGGPAGPARGGGRDAGEHPTYAWAAAQGGDPKPHPPKDPGGATFKWSRDNGSIAVAVDEAQTSRFVVKTLGRDDRTSIDAGDWVELLDDAGSLLNRGTRNLLMVDAVDPDTRELTLSGKFTDVASDTDHLHIRRWDHAKGTTVGLADGAIPVEEGTWLRLENGVEVWFKPGGQYRPGDYWLIPARFDTGEVEWPGPPDDPKLRRPRGIMHHYAPLALVEFDSAGGFVDPPTDLRRLFLELGGSRRTAARTLWTSPLGLVADDGNATPQVQIERDSTVNLVRITSDAAATAQTVWLPLAVSDDLKVQEIVVSYRAAEADTSIGRIRVLEQHKPGDVTIMHDELATLNSTVEVEHRTALNDPVTPAGPWLFGLELTFGGEGHWIDLGGVGIVMR